MPKDKSNSDWYSKYKDAKPEESGVTDSKPAEPSPSEPVLTEESQQEPTTGPVIDFMKMMKQMRGNQIPEGYVVSGMEDFILRYGRKYRSAPLIREEADVLRKVVRSGGQFVVKQCFYNAQKIALASSGRIKYVEGMALSHFFPMHHGWNTINDKVIDFTWRVDDQPVLGVIPEGWEYWGVQISPAMILAYWKKHKESGAFLENYVEQFPIFRKPYAWPKD